MSEMVSAVKNVQVWKLFQDKVDTVLCGDPKESWSEIKILRSGKIFSSRWDEQTFSLSK